MDPSLTPLFACVDQLANQFDALRKLADKGMPAADIDPDLGLTRACMMLEHVVREVYGRPTRDPPVRFPTRFTNLHAIRAKYGILADKIAPYFFQSDPLADEADAQLTHLRPPGRGRTVFELALTQGIAKALEAPPALRCLFAQIMDTPVWLDEGLLKLGSQTHQRGGVISGIVLATSCLPLAYRSAAGNKPLVYTGRLVDRATRRMVETTRFFVDSFTPGGLTPGAPGWQRTIQVRLMHSAMRRWLRRQQKHPWKDDDLGAPINQMDLAATSLLFSVSLLGQLRKLGFHFTAAETQGVMHLWRYSGHLLGIAPELLSTTEAEGTKLLDLLLDLAGPSDAHLRELTEVLMKGALPAMIRAGFPRLFRLGGLVDKERMSKQLTRFCYGLSHGLLGNTFAAELGYPSTAWRITAPMLLRPLITFLESCRRVIPGGTRLAARLGFNQITRLLENMARSGRPGA